MSNIKILLGKRIRELRKAKGLTQEKLAEFVGINTANISYIETGKYAPSIENFEKIALALGVQPVELYMFEPLKDANEIKAELMEAFEKDEDLMRLIYKFYLSVK